MGVSLVGDRSAKPDDNDNYGDDDGDGEIDEQIHLPFKIPPGRNMSCYDMSGNAGFSSRRIMKCCWMKMVDDPVGRF